jgi:hypothetical protein
VDVGVVEGADCSGRQTQFLSTRVGRSVPFDRSVRPGDDGGRQFATRRQTNDGAQAAAAQSDKSMVTTKRFLEIVGYGMGCLVVLVGIGVGRNAFG